MTVNYIDFSTQLNGDCYMPGRDGQQVRVLVCHSTCGPVDRNPGDKQRSDAAARYLASNDREVSAHWLVGAEGIGAPIYRVVRESDTAYHAGGSMPNSPSKWVDPDNGLVYGRFSLNLVSIGIEVFGQSDDVLGPNQLAALKALVQDIATRNPILKDPRRIVAHAELEGDRTDGRNWAPLARKWVQELTNSQQQSSPAPAPADVITLNGFQLGHGFLNYWMNNGGLKVFGLPLTNEFKNPLTGFTTQVFERMILEYHPDNPADWQVLGFQAGRFWLDANRGKLPLGV